MQPCLYRAVSSSSTDLTLVSYTYHGAEERRVDGAEVRHDDLGECEVAKVVDDNEARKTVEVGGNVVAAPFLARAIRALASRRLPEGDDDERSLDSLYLPSCTRYCTHGIRYPNLC